MSYSEVKGDLLHMAVNGKFDIIVHGCNCFCTMGSGIAAQIKKRFPNAYRADRCTKRGYDKRGQFSWAQHDTAVKILTIINAYTQYDYGRDGKDRFDYDGFRTILCQLRIFCHPRAKIGFPQIGGGLANGDWNRIKEIIQEELKGFDVTVVIYE